MFDGTDFVAISPLEGGWSGETFVAEMTTGERVVVRIHARRPVRAEVDAALMRLVRGLLPVPEVLEVRRADATSATPALLVTEFVDGVRGDLLLPTLDTEGRRRLGHALGEVAASLAGMPHLRAGDFVDAELTVEPWDLPDGLPGFVDAHDLPDWSVEEVRSLRRLAARFQDLLDTVPRICLVHSDLNPKNVLVDPGTLRVSAVVDWEFAHAGHPFTDLGNLLRFERDEAYADGVLSAFRERHDVTPQDARALARAADLWALVDLAARRDANPVARRAHDLLRTGLIEWTDSEGPA